MAQNATGHDLGGFLCAPAAIASGKQQTSDKQRKGSNGKESQDTCRVRRSVRRNVVIVFVGGVDVAKGFKVAVEGTTATIVLRDPFERTGDAAVSSKPPCRENDDGKTVTPNVEVVPGLYCAADSAATIEALKRPGAMKPAKIGDMIVVPKQSGAQGFYKAWVSEMPIVAE